jgi:GR25 family glycosyltransferase involved in LPS biosynthesis
MKSICINLDSRPDRWKEAQQEFHKIGLAVERLPAVTGDNRPLAFNQSVFKAMELAGGDLLLFEDDVVFEWPELVSLKGIIPAILDQKPEDALTVHLGCNIIGIDLTRWQMPTQYDSLFAKLHNCYQSHATWYSAEAVEIILKKLDPYMLTEDNNIFDDWLRRKVLSIGRSYVLKPMIAYQRPSFSDIWSTFTDYSGCHKQGNEWMKKHLP